MIANFTLKIGGEAGFGIMTAGLIFSKTCTRSGFHIFDYAEYPSLIRGGHNVMETHFSTSEVYSQERAVDLLVALNQETVGWHQKELKGDGGIVFDPDEVKVEGAGQRFPIPLGKIVTEIGGPKVMINNVALGAAVGVFGLDIKTLLGVIGDVFVDKGAEVVKKNQQAAQAGYDYVSGDASPRQRFYRASPSGFEVRERLVLTGNEAVSLGAIAAGCRFYAAYPMTPSTSILHFLAERAEEVKMIVRHAEDEIGAINEAIGASFAGVRSMVGTSGGGFALMNEAVSLVGITETPLVIVVAQRPGPATGMPTWTEQGDLQFIIHSGHGEFSKIVLAPGDVGEAIALTQKAFYLADIYKTPAVIVSDKYLAESHKSIESAKLKKSFPSEIQSAKLEIDRGKPGLYFQANSYEHLEDGHTTEDAKERIKQVNKRSQKIEIYLKNHFQGPKLYGSKEADVTLVGWGSTKGPVLQAQLKSGNFNFLHFTNVWPMGGEQIKAELEKHKKLVLIENNSTGQFGQLLRQETGIDIQDKLLKYDGRPFYPEEVLDYVSERF